MRIAYRSTPAARNTWPHLVGAVERSPLAARVQQVQVEPGVCPEDANVLAYSFTSAELGKVVGELKRLRRRGACPLLAAGGSHASADPEGSLALGFDLVFVGEGESAWLALLGELLETGRVEPGVRQGRAEDLDAHVSAAPGAGLFPFPEISRGCSRGCLFCQTPRLFGRPMRHRSPEVVAAGLRAAMAAGHRRFRFLSPDAFSYGGGDVKQRVAALEELLRRCRATGARQLMLGFFPSEVRPDTTEPALVELVRRHCQNGALVIGAQGGADSLLSRMRRGHTVEQARRAIRLCREAGLKALVDLIFAFPGETPDERRATLEFLKEGLKDPGVSFHVHHYVPLPGDGVWPAPPETLEPEIWRELDKLEQNSRVQGYFHKQRELGKQILSWREQGLIRV